MTFLQVIEKADLIAESEIVAINDSMFWVKLKYIIKGTVEKKIIKVRKFKDWPCAHRFSKYKVKQKVLLAAVMNSSNSNWLIVGIGDEGELPIINNNITFKRLLFNNNYKNPQTYRRTDVYNGIKYYLKNKESLYKSIDNGKILNFYPENKFTEALVKTLIWKNYKKFDWNKSEERLNK